MALVVVKSKLDTIGRIPRWKKNGCLKRRSRVVNICRAKKDISMIDSQKLLVKRKEFRNILTRPFVIKFVNNWDKARLFAK